MQTLYILNCNECAAARPRNGFGFLPKHSLSHCSSTLTQTKVPVKAVTPINRPGDRKQLLHQTPHIRLTA